MPLDGTEPIGDDEVLYRRIPVSRGWYDPIISDKPSPEAFGPRKEDTTGISLSRGDPYCTIEQLVGIGMSKSGYYVLVMKNAGELRRRGIRVEPRPVPENLGHVEFPDLNYLNRESPEAQSMMVLLANELSDHVLGPFRGSPPPPAK